MFHNKNSSIPVYLRQFCFLIWMLWQGAIFAQPLSGTYTIGGSAPNFISFTAAVASLNSNGVSGPVTFNIRPGIYQEQIKINSYPGASSLRPVVFQSETGNPEDVILKHMHPSTTTNFNYTIYLDGAKHLTFQNISIKAEKETPSSTQKNRVLYITNHSDSVFFDNNHIISWQTTAGTLDYNACILIGSDGLTGVQNDYVSFTNNTIIGGYTGLKIEADNLNMSKSPLILNNSFQDQGWYGIFLTWTENPKLDGNEVITHGALPLFTGINVYNTKDSLTINGNFLDLPGGATSGIVIGYSQNSDSDFRFVSNNMINIGPELTSPNLPRGIRSIANDTIYVVHNSVNIHQATTNGSAFETQDNDHVVLLNNQLIHLGGGQSYKVTNNTSSLFNSNNNNLYNNGGTVLCTVEASVYSSPSTIFAGEGSDEFSIQSDPLFIFDSLLISFNPASYDAGFAATGISNDFYNNSRSPISPDIGCFEGALSDPDAGIVGHNLNHVHLCAGDSLQVTVDIKNFGMSNLISTEIFAGTADSIYFSATWTGNLVQFDQENDFPVGYFIADSADYSEFKIWCSGANGLGDNMPYNDTVYVNTRNAMKGTYTIGIDSSDHFLSFTDAVEALKEAGVCGPVLLIADPGTYPEQFIIPAISGASAINTITFDSQNQDSSEVTIEYSAYNTTNNYVVQLKGSSYIAFKNISIRPLNSNYRYGLRLSYGASHNTFSNCRFITTGTTGTAEKALVFFDGWFGGTLDSNIFVNNHFVNGGRQAFLDCEASDPSTGNVFVGNLFTGTATVCITAEGQKNLTIIGNTMTGTRDNPEGIAGIQLESCEDSLRIEKNKLYLANAYDFALIGIMNYEPAPGYGSIRNNFFSSTASVEATGARFSNVSNLEVVNNSFKNSSDYPVVAEFSYCNAMQIYSNIFNAMNGSSCYLLSNTDTAQIHSDYNAFYTSSGSDSLVKVFYTSSPTYHSMTAWQNLTGEDMHSIFTDPQYVSSSDLHINNASAINNKALPVLNLQSDIDNETRDPATPDIGADEFDIDSATYYDIELVSVLHPNNTQCLANDSLTIMVVNHSIFAIDSFIVEWSLFDVLNNSVSIIQNLMPGDTQEVYVGSLDFIQLTFYDIKFGIFLPNDHPDNYMDNNYGAITFGFIESIEIKSYYEPCTGATELVIEKFPVDSILWSTGSTANSITVTTPGNYSVSVFKNGCETTVNYLLE